MELTGQLHGPAALPRGKSPRYPLDRRLGGPQSRSGRGGEVKNPYPGRPARKLVTTMTDVPRPSVQFVSE